MSIPARTSLVTLGVADLERSTAFYEQLGWKPAEASVPGAVTFFAMAGAHLALFPISDLSAETGLRHDSARTIPNSTIAVNCDDRQQVDAAFDIAKAAGATIVHAPRAMDWGGYSGYFADPDGHLWEVAHNPAWPIGEDGRPELQ
jgi:catechol 2,3-dioxygenase-like lactoylglutathione lyase family enzyme